MGIPVPYLLSSLSSNKNPRTEGGRRSLVTAKPKAGLKRRRSRAHIPELAFHL